MLKKNLINSVNSVNSSRGRLRNMSYIFELSSLPLNVNLAFGIHDDDTPIFYCVRMIPENYGSFVSSNEYNGEIFSIINSQL